MKSKMKNTTKLRFPLGKHLFMQPVLKVDDDKPDEFWWQPDGNRTEI